MAQAVRPLGARIFPDPNDSIPPGARVAAPATTRRRSGAGGEEGRAESAEPRRDLSA